MSIHGQRLSVDTPPHAVTLCSGGMKDDFYVFQRLITSKHDRKHALDPMAEVTREKSTTNPIIILIEWEGGGLVHERKVRCLNITLRSRSQTSATPVGRCHITAVQGAQAVVRGVAVLVKRKTTSHISLCRAVGCAKEECRSELLNVQS